jgi:hypothetical protein
MVEVTAGVPVSAMVMLSGEGTVGGVIESIPKSEMGTLTVTSVL